MEQIAGYVKHDHVFDMFINPQNDHMLRIQNTDICLVSSQYAIAKYHRRGGSHKQQNFISHGSGGWKTGCQQG